MNKIRTAVIGVGYLGKFHAEKYKKIPTSELIAVCDTNVEQCKKIAAQYETEAVEDYRQLIGKVDAVSIAAPTPLHHEIGLFFLKHGVNVLIEKPISTTTQEADELIAAAKHNKVILQVGHLERFNNAVKAVEPTLSNPRFIESLRLAPFKARGTDVNVILDLMIHDIDIIQSIVKSNISKISANGASVLSNFIDIANARIEFENGCVANVTASRVSLKTERRLRIFQHNGYISMDLDNKVIASYHKGSKEMLPGVPEIISEEKQYEKTDALHEQIEAFLDCIIHNKRPLVDGETGKRALATAIEITNIARQANSQHLNPKGNTRICIVAGEASGDLLGANFTKCIREQKPGIEVIGMGGSQMKAAGVDLIINAEEQLMLIGFIDVIKNLGTIRKAMKTMVDALKTQRPDLLVLIDYPGFNLRLAKQAKKLGIKVLYYSCPQIWAWHYSRIHKIKKYIDHMAVLFPFEKEMYDKENMPATFVGHPLVDNTEKNAAVKEALDNYDLKLEHPTIALLPGSRLSEIEKILPSMVAAAALIKNEIPDAQFILPIAPNLSIKDIKPFLSKDIHFADHDIHQLLPLCNAAIVTSGTATLEIALHKIPMVIVYKATALNYWIARTVINKKIKYIGLCNLIAGEEIARELIQNDVKPRIIADEILRILNDETYRASILEKMAKMKDKLGGGDCSNKAADIALQLLSPTSTA